MPPQETDKLLDRAHVSPMVMAGREARGWLRVDPDGLKTKRQLARLGGPRGEPRAQPAAEVNSAVGDLPRRVREALWTSLSRWCNDC